MANTNAAKGAKKGRRFNQPRSEKAKRACAARKEQRIAENKLRADVNAENRADGIPTAWEEAKAKRKTKREEARRAAKHGG